MNTANMNIKDYMHTIGVNARAASRQMASATTNTKNLALTTIAKAILREKANLLAANEADFNGVVITSLSFGDVRKAHGCKCSGSGACLDDLASGGLVGHRVLLLKLNAGYNKQFCLILILIFVEGNKKPAGFNLRAVESKSSTKTSHRRHLRAPSPIPVGRAQIGVFQWTSCKPLAGKSFPPGACPRSHRP